METRKFITISTIITIVLFLVSFLLNDWLNAITKMIAIIYLIFFILFLLLRKEPKIIKLSGKKARTKKFTGSTYKKIFHRKECRFADSIKDEYFIENNDKDFFQKEGYKPCKLCMGKKIDKTNLKKK